MSPKKQTIQIDRGLLRPCRKIAKVLGISLAEFIEFELRCLAQDIEKDLSLSEIAERWVSCAWASRKQAQRVAERFEAFAIEEKLAGNERLGTIDTKVLPTPDRGWTIEVSELFGPGGKWRKALNGSLDDQNDEDEDDQDEALGL